MRDPGLICVDIEHRRGIGTDDMGSKQVHAEVPFDGQTISKYSLVRRTMDLAAERKSLFYH